MAKYKSKLFSTSTTMSIILVQDNTQMYSSCSYDKTQLVVFILKKKKAQVIVLVLKY